MNLESAVIFVFSILFAAFFAWDVRKSLRKRVIWLRGWSARDIEPIQYWLVMLISVAAGLVFVWLAIEALFDQERAKQIFTSLVR